MSQYMVPLPDLVIPNGQQDSNILYERGVITATDPIKGGTAGPGVTDGFGFRDADNIEIFAPAVLAETVLVQVDSAFQAPPDNFDTLQIAGVDVTIPAGKSIIIQGPTFRQIKIHANGPVAAQRTFKVNKRVRI